MWGGHLYSHHLKIFEDFLANTSTSFESLPGELIDAANEKGGHDNVSVILIRFDK